MNSISALLPRKESFVFIDKIFLRISCQDTQNDVKRPEKRFVKKCPSVYVCVWIKLIAFSLLPLSLKLIHGWDFMTIWIS